MVDSNDRERAEEAKDELAKMVSFFFTASALNRCSVTTNIVGKCLTVPYDLRGYISTMSARSVRGWEYDSTSEK